MIIFLVLLFALLFFGLGFAAHLLWIVATIVFFVWIIGLALGRGSSGRPPLLSVVSRVGDVRQDEGHRLPCTRSL
jgi:type IV secretory pathway TrbD component